MVDFLGHRDDLEQLLPMCDVAVASSIREGLPVNIMEAMACGLPVLASDNRGHRELISNKVNGYLIPVNDCFQYALRLLELSRSKVSREAMGIENVNKIKRYAIPMIRAELSDVYTPYMVGDEDETQGQYYCAHL
jgi:glycosyltransferase EpsD